MKIIWLAPLLLFPGLLLISSPFPAPDSFLPQFWAYSFFGLFFAAGFLLFDHPQWLDRLQIHWVYLLVGSLLLYGIYYQLLPKSIAMPPAPVEFFAKVSMKLCEAFVSVWMTLVCLILGRRYLNSPSGGMRLMADSSYWIYIIHVPLLFALQYQLMDRDWNWVAKFFASALITLVIGLLSYLLLVRRSPIGWLLNGRKKSVASAPLN